MLDMTQCPQLPLGLEVLGCNAIAEMPNCYGKALAYLLMYQCRWHLSRTGLRAMRAPEAAKAEGLSIPQLLPHQTYPRRPACEYLTIFDAPRHT